jgi:hypothetical protein
VRVVPEGTAHVLSFTLTKLTSTGPFVPGAPRWIWAAVPATPVVVTVPVTVGQLLALAADGHLDSPTAMSVLPEPLASGHRGYFLGSA